MLREEITLSARLADILGWRQGATVLTGRARSDGCSTIVLRNLDHEGNTRHCSEEFEKTSAVVAGASLCHQLFHPNRHSETAARPSQIRSPPLRSLCPRSDSLFLLLHRLEHVGSAPSFPDKSPWRKFIPVSATLPTNLGRSPLALRDEFDDSAVQTLLGGQPDTKTNLNTNLGVAIPGARLCQERLT